MCVGHSVRVRVCVFVCVRVCVRVDGVYLWCVFFLVGVILVM